eukprot:scpid98541/ scgid23322/ 
MQQAMKFAFEHAETEALLLVDAQNAFNSLNRCAALHNIARVCPPRSQISTNTYQSPTTLYLSGGGSILSREGTTQDDPLSMVIYASALKPLVKSLCTSVNRVCQGWYADDSAAAGK